MKHFKILFLILISIFCCSCIEAKTGKVGFTSSKEVTKKLIVSEFIQQQITENLFILKSVNYNTNIGVFIGSESLLLIDPMGGFNNHASLLETIKQLSDKPIKYVVNTHHHLDHSGASGFFKELGAVIISHENAQYSNALTDVTFKNTYSIDLGDETVTLFHNVSHTFDDVLVYFNKNNTVFMGDTYMTNSFPHSYYGGGSNGHLSIIDKALSLGNEETIIIPAHGNLSSNKTELAAYRDNSVKWFNRIAQLYNEGNTSDVIADDYQIQRLSSVFNAGRDVSKQNIQRTLDKTISIEHVESTTLSEEHLRALEGSFTYSNGQVDEVIFLNRKLILQSKGKYIYEIIPLSNTKFHIKGQFPNKHLTFSDDLQQFIFFDGKENLNARRK
ncbi:MAG: MBL fold metallo-hydrolase [Balneola sp.]|jgi:glyoxylase-like metal-dependent hydrolase (beta-lactamase superfamily II)